MQLDTIHIFSLGRVLAVLSPQYIVSRRTKRYSKNIDLTILLYLPAFRSVVNYRKRLLGVRKFISHKTARNSLAKNFL